MRVSKIEPHVLQLAADNADVESFLAEVQEEAASVRPTKTQTGLTEESVQSEQDSLKQSFVRLVDFLKKSEKHKKPQRSKKAIALQKYSEQIRLSADPVSEEEIEKLSAFEKYS